MNKINFLPPWVETNLQPAFYDRESGTCLQQTARMYAKVNQLVRSVNDQNETIADYIQQFIDLKDFVDDYFDNLDVQEEINNKLDEMVEDGTFQELLDAYFPKKVDYYHITSESTSADIISAFAVDNAKVIEFDYGTYELTSDLILTSNTTVNLNGATLTRDGSEWLLGYGRDSAYTGYNGIHNVKINDGSIQLPIALMHNANITFTNVTFLPVNDHAIQIASCKHIVIESCTFDGRIIDDTKKDHYETVQLETATRGGQPFLNDADSASYDHGINYDIEIKDCKFKKGDGENTKNYTAIGHHSDDDTNHYFVENIKISGCTIESAYYSQMCPVGFNYAIIENCTFNQADDITEVYNIRFRYQNKNVTIRNNAFIGGYANINSVNMSAEFGTNLLIENNTFSTTYLNNIANIVVRTWDGAVIRNNKFGNATNHNILLSGDGTNPCLNVTIESNEFADSNLATTTDASLVYLRRCSNTQVVNNKVQITTGVDFTYITTADCTNYSIANNFIDFKTNANYKPVNGSSGWDAINVKQVPIKCWEASSAAYAAITDQSLTSHRFADFDTINLLMHKTNAGGKMFVGLVKGYAFNGKLDTSSQRIYCFYYNDGTDTFEGTLTVKTDGTFSYTSTTSNLTLRAIYGINTI